MGNSSATKEEVFRFQHLEESDKHQIVIEYWWRCINMQDNHESEYVFDQETGQYYRPIPNDEEEGDNNSKNKTKNKNKNKSKSKSKSKSKQTAIANTYDALFHYKPKSTPEYDPSFYFTFLHVRTIPRVLMDLILLFNSTTRYDPVWNLRSKNTSPYIFYTNQKVAKYRYISNKIEYSNDTINNDNSNSNTSTLNVVPNKSVFDKPTKASFYARIGLLIPSTSASNVKTMNHFARVSEPLPSHQRHINFGFTILSPANRMQDRLNINFDRNNAITIPGCHKIGLISSKYEKYGISNELCFVGIYSKTVIDTAYQYDQDKNNLVHVNDDSYKGDTYIYNGRLTKMKHYNNIALKYNEGLDIICNMKGFKKQMKIYRSYTKETIVIDIPSSTQRFYTQKTYKMKRDENGNPILTKKQRNDTEKWYPCVIFCVAGVYRPNICLQFVSGAVM